MHGTGQLTHDQMREWGYFLEEETNLSPQESQIFVRLFYLNKTDICDDLNIEKPHLETVIRRIQEKIGDAEATHEIGKALSSRKRWRTKSVPFNSALVGCSGPECDKDVETAKTDAGFNDFYTKTINLYDNEETVNNVRTLYFCSLECLNTFEE